MDLNGGTRPDVFKNFISKDDLPLLMEKLRQGHGPRVLQLLAFRAARRRMQNAWETAESAPKHWGSIEAVNDRWNLLSTGDASVHIYEHVARLYLGDRDDHVAVSIACGTGAHEVRWARTGRFARIDGYDISEPRIGTAQERAADAGVEDVAHFRVADVRSLDVASSSLDVVIAINALHHITPLGATIDWIERVLKPGGMIILRDYVGPDRFQWTQHQIEAADQLLHSLPIRYRIRWGSGTVKKRNLLPGRLTMWLTDPSEAAESSRIVPLLDERFECLERKSLGGAVLHLVLKDIAHHFCAGDPKAERHLERLMVAEDDLMAKGEVQSDFIFGVWRKSSESKMQNAK